jgi:hypothetical protein
MELIKLILFCTAYSVFSMGNFISFVLFYLLCMLVLSSKINIESNNESYAILFNALHLILNLSILSSDFILFKMKQNTYLNKVFQLYDIVNSAYLNVYCKAKEFFYGCCSSKELKTPKEINRFLDSIND